MDSSDDAYAELLQTVERARDKIDQLKKAPPSAGRDIGLSRLRDDLGRAIMLLSDIKLNGHHD